MNSTASSSGPAAAAHPLQSLVHHARQQPAGLALKWRHEGSWQTLSWSQLARRVQRAAQGWRALGVQADDAVLVPGSRGEAPLVSLLSLLSLGAHVQWCEPGALAARPPGARFALARDTQEVDRLLAHPPGTLRAIVVEHPFGTEPSPQVKVLGWTDLLQLDPAGDALIVPERDTVALVTPDAEGQPRPWPLAALAAAGQAPGRHWAVADFDLGWLPGVRWLLSEWLASGRPLLLASDRPATAPGGSRLGTALWLVSGQTLNSFVDAVMERARPGGWAAWALRQRPTWPVANAAAWLLRSRIRQVLGWPPGLQVLTDGQARAESLQLLGHLGARCHLVAGDLQAQATSHPSHPLRVVPRSDRVEPLLTQVST